MRTAAMMLMGLLALGASACGGEAAADPELPPMVDVEPPVVTDTVAEPDTTPESIIAGQVEDCVRYVPFAAGTGNFYMHVIWQQAGESPVELRNVCAQIAIDDPAGLARMSAEQQALDAFFAAVSATTTIPDCAPGSTLDADGYCA